MIAIELQAPRHLRSIDVAEPSDPGPGEIRVDVKRIGVCGTDWHSFAGDNPFFEYPRILGHELGVQVVAIGPGTETPLAEGHLCAVEPYLNDPTSPASRRGKTNCCESLRVLGVHMDGGMCPHLVLPAGKLHPSSQLDLGTLALVETLCIGAHGCERARLSKDDHTLVVGAGPIGLSAYQFARLECENVILADISPARLAFCQKHLGIEATLEISPTGGDEEIDARFKGKPTVIMDATGNTGSMERAFRLIGHGGRIVFLGIVQGNIAFEDPAFHRKELTVLASRNAPASTFSRVIAQLEAGRVDTRPWITHRLPLDEVPERLPLLEGDPHLLKAMVEV